MAFGYEHIELAAVPAESIEKMIPPLAESSQNDSAGFRYSGTESKL